VTRQPEVVVDDLYFPESLRWHAGELWFSDIFGQTVHAYGAGQLRTITQLTDWAGGLGWLPNGDLLVVSMRERRVLRLGQDGILRPHADLADLIDYAANDMYVDPSGRAYVGSYGYDVDRGAPIAEVPLVVIDVDGSARLAGSPLVFPNGIDRRHTQRELLVAETFADRLSRVLLGDDGEPGASQVFATVASGDGPDGIVCDSHGGVWVACAYGQRVLHISPTGEIDEVIPVTGRGVLSCALGGPHGRTLYLAVASTDEEYAARHRTGSILAVAVD
jgi:sugar lactone lactonase YvrE